MAVEIATLAEIKEGLRIDYTDEDNYIGMCMNAAYEYLNDSIDDFEDKLAVERFLNKAKIPYILIIQELFDSRSLMTKDNEKIKHIVSSMLTQMRYCTYDTAELV